MAEVNRDLDEADSNAQGGVAITVAIQSAHVEDRQARHRAIAKGASGYAPPVMLRIQKNRYGY